MSSVVFDHVCKVFYRTVAVDGLDLTIHDQEFMVLLGPSGCGKTTALRMIAGLETVTSGTLSIGDRVVNDIPASDRDIAMVFQSYALYPHMTVRKNIESPLVAHKGRRVDAAERERRVREAADILGLGDYLWRTWHPRTRPERVTLDDTVWTSLEILDIVDGSERDQVGVVEFDAHFRQGRQRGTLHERSRFERRGRRWLYLDGEHRP